MKVIKFFFTLNMASLLFSALCILIALVGTFGPTRFAILATTIAQAGFGVAIFAFFGALLFTIILMILQARRRKAGLPNVNLGTGLTILAFSLAAVNQGFFFLMLVLFPSGSIG